MVTPGKLNRRSALFEQLATMISSGVPLTKALEMAGRNRSNGVSNRTIQDLNHHLKEGHTFTDAMQIVSGQKRSDGSVRHINKACWLTDFDVALLSAGEESGRLDVTFKTLARYYAARARVIHDTIAGSLITIVTLHVFLLVFPVGLLVLFVLGLVNGEYGKCVPFIIEKVVAYGALYASVWFLAFSTQGNRAEGWRTGIEAMFGIVPWLGSAIKYLAVARLAMALESLMNAGVPVIRSWEMAAASCGSPRLKREILKWTPELESGTTPGDMVSQIKYFPDMFAQLYQSAELSGRHDEALTHLHAYFEQEGFRKLAIFSKALMFFLYFIIVIAIGYFVITFYLEHYRQMMESF